MKTPPQTIARIIIGKIFHLLFPILLTLIFSVKGYPAVCLTDADCNDGNFCTNDICDPSLGCLHPPRTDCDDGIDCTRDCDPFSGCEVVPQNFLCDDGVPCTQDNCDPSSGCRNDPQSILCVDGNFCTDDICDPSLGCLFPPRTDCDDGIDCTRDCDPFSGCEVEPQDFLCNDGVSCTQDNCDPSSGCRNNPQSILCVDDHNFCTDDICDPSLGCLYPPRTACDDGIDCTRDCDPLSGCEITPQHFLCDDGNACNLDFCALIFGCTHFFDCNNNNSCCDDANPCTDDICMPSGFCDNPLIDCSDRNPCTNDFCNSQGVCEHTRMTCDDGDACTDDVCAIITEDDFECISRPKDCNDNNICTADDCVDGECINTDISPVVNAGADKIVFPAYSPAACATLSAATSGGTPNYTYSWSNGATTASITVCPKVSTNYCVTVTDANGCQGTDCVRICVRNISCATKKVLVCHKSPTGGLNTICIATSAVPAHLAHGDKLGQCGLVPCSAASKTSEGAESMMNEVESIQAYPNPFSDKLNIEFTLADDSRITLEIYNISGQRLAVLFDGDVKADETQTFEYNPNLGCDCMAIYRLQTERGTYYGKAVMVR